MNIKYEVVIDLKKTYREHRILIKKNDDRSRTLHFFIQESGKKYDMSSVYFATIRAINPDESIIYADATILKDEEGNKLNEVEYDLPKTITKAVGTTTLEVELISSTEQIITSFNIYIEVENTLYDEDDYVMQSDLGGFRSYMVRAQGAAEMSEEIRNSFIIAYGTVEEITQELNGEVEEYNQYLEDLKERVDSGEFNGERGAQGENGADAVVSGAGFLYGCQIVDGNLVIYYDNSEDEPPFYINEDGELCIDVEEGDY
jgi:hypothetical protein